MCVELFGIGQSNENQSRSRSSHQSQALRPTKRHKFYYVSLMSCLMKTDRLIGSRLMAVVAFATATKEGFRRCLLLTCAWYVLLLLLDEGLAEIFLCKTITMSCKTAVVRHPVSIDKGTLYTTSGEPKYTSAAYLLS